MRPGRFSPLQPYWLLTVRRRLPPVLERRWQWWRPLHQPPTVSDRARLPDGWWSPLRWPRILRVGMGEFAHAAAAAPYGGATGRMVPPRPAPHVISQRRRQARRRQRPSGQ